MRNSLGQDDPPVRVKGTEAKAVCGLPLAFVNGNDTGPENLRGISPFKQAQSKHGRGKATQIKDRRHDEVNKEQLDQKRRIPDQLQIPACDHSGQIRIRQTAQGTDQSETEGKNKADPCDLKSDDETVDQRAGEPLSILIGKEILGDPIPLPVISQFGGPRCRDPGQGRHDQQESSDIYDGRSFRVAGGFDKRHSHT